MITSVRSATVFVAALLTTILIPSAKVWAFENVNMNVDLSVNGDGKILVQWRQQGFDEYHVGWRVNGGPRGSRTRPGNKLFTVLMRYSPGAVYEVGVQGCTKHIFGHDECTSWDTVTCGEPRSPCVGSPEAQRFRRPGYTY